MTRPELLAFGGKGGVGKTTCAAAAALARAERGAHVLVLSTDPAHSLGDAFALRLGPRPRQVPTPAGRLEALELDAASAVTRWMRTHRPALSELLDRGTLLDREDISNLLDLPLPGIDELAAFLALARLEPAGRYQTVILDTAPTGHTRRLLQTPELVDRLAALFEAMFERGAAVVRALGGRVAMDSLAAELQRDAGAVAERLHKQAAFSWVTLPEPVTIGETIEGIEYLRRRGFRLADIVVNRITPAPKGSCSECRARRAEERAALAPLARLARRVPVRLVARQPDEPRGIAPLRRIARELSRARDWREVGSTGRSAPGCRPAYRGPIAQNGERAVIPPPSVRLLLVAGKGGVGKSTCAAAIALAAGRREPSRRIRLVSVDPAPSLRSVLRMEVGDGWRRVPGNWHVEVRELDAQALFDRYRERYRQAVARFFERMRKGSAFEARADREVFERLIDLAPPGIDELMGLLSVLELFEDESNDLVVVDTAPTGHTERFLASPQDVRHWVAALMRLVVKYRLAARDESVAADLLAISRGLRLFQERLADPSRAWLVAVTRPAMLPRLETERLLARVKTLGIRPAAVVLNALTAGTCSACRAWRRIEEKERARIARLCTGAPSRTGRADGCAIIHAPLQVPAPRGVRTLLDWAHAWRVVPRQA